MRSLRPRAARVVYAASLGALCGLSPASGARAQSAPAPTNPPAAAVVRAVSLPTVAAEGGAPRNRLELVLPGAAPRIEVVARQITGDCATQENTAQRVLVRCWWAGGGDEYELQVARGAVVVRSRTVGEEGNGPWHSRRVATTATQLRSEVRTP